MTPKNVKCSPDEVSIKSFFLGPAAENAEWLEVVLREIFQSWYAWRRLINSKDCSVISSEDQALPEFIAQQEQTKEVIKDLVKRFEGEIPKFSPRYIGHMFSEVSMPALLGHFITLLHNPNNISPDASRIGTEIEIEAINYLKKIVGYSEGVGHFTSGGTVANFEFLFRARERLASWLAAGVASGNSNAILAAHMGWEEFNSLKNRISKDELEKYFILNSARETYSQIQRKIGDNIGEPILLVPASKHYSWPKAMHFLGLGESNIRFIELDRFGRACAKNLKYQIDRAMLAKNPILGVVGVVGTTELGTIDPIDSFVNVLDEFKKNEGLNIWLHIDGAYGGFMGSLVNGSNENSQINSDYVQKSLIAMAASDSITLDPHKLGYVPYSSGAFICRDEQNYFIKSFTGPYIVSEERTLGNYTLEGSRSAAGAVATFASIKSFNSSQGYKKLLRRTINSKNEFQANLKKMNFALFIPDGLDTNILCFAPVGNARGLAEINIQTLKLYERVQNSGEYWMSKTSLSVNAFGELIKDFCKSYNIERDCAQLELLRLTLMNPFTISKESAVDHVSIFCTLLENEFSNLSDKK